MRLQEFGKAQKLAKGCCFSADLIQENNLSANSLTDAATKSDTSEGLDLDKYGVAFSNESMTPEENLSTIGKRSAVQMYSWWRSNLTLEDL